MLNIFALDLVHSRTRSKIDSVEAAYRDAYALDTSAGVILLAANKEDMPLPQVSRLLNRNEFSGSLEVERS